MIMYKNVYKWKFRVCCQESLGGFHFSNFGKSEQLVWIRSFSFLNSLDNGLSMTIDKHDPYFNMMMTFLAKLHQNDVLEVPLW